MKRIAAQVMIVAVIAAIGYGVHKSDENTQQQLAAATHKTAVQTYNLCAARNAAVLVSNGRWGKMSRFLSQAATLRAAQSRTDAASLARLDLYFARTWQAYADAIRPLPTADCGEAP